MNKKIIFLVFASIFLIGSVQASIIGLIASEGLNFINPQLAQAVQTVMCVTSPGGIITCAKNFVGGKVIGEVSGEILQEIAKVSPEAAQAIIKYNTIKGYIDKGGEILDEIKIDEQGFYSGTFKFNDETSILDSFPNSTLSDISTANSVINYNDKILTINEGGYLKLKIKDDQGHIQELEYGNIADGGKFELNDDGTIKSAAFTTSDSAMYIFGNNGPLEVSAGTKVYYEKGVVQIMSSNNFLYDGINIDGEDGIVDISEDEIKCASCNINGIKLVATNGNLGSLEIKNNGYLIRNGEATYQQNKIITDSLNKQILIGKPSAELSNYNGNWLQQTDRTLEIHSSEEGEVEVVFLEDHKILNTDDKDGMSAKILNGDGIKIVNRNEKGLIPSLTHLSSENGETNLNDGGLKVKLVKGAFYSYDYSLPTTTNLNSKYQSVALEIIPSFTKHGMVINAYREFSIINKDGKELVTYNGLGLPISTNLEDNQLQTYDQLMEKYPSLKMIFPETITEPGGKGKILNDMNEKNLAPSMVYALDQFIQQNPSADYGNVTFIISHGLKRAFYESGNKTINLGLDGLRLSSSRRFNLEDTNPIDVIKHEYEHYLDDKINELEQNYLGGNIEVSKLQNQINILKKEVLTMNKEIQTESNWENQQRLAKEQNKLLDEMIVLTNQRDNIENSYGPLKFKYLEIGENAMDQLLEDDSTIVTLNAINKQILRSRVGGGINYILKNERNIDIETYLKNNLGIDNFDNTNGDTYIKLIDSLLSESDEKSKLKDNELTYLKNLKELVILIQKDPTEKGYDISEQLSLEEPKVSGQFSREINQLVRSKSGLPYAYSLSKESTNTDSNARFPEISSTFTQMTTEQISFELHHSVSLITRETFTKLTQLAFDSGKMGLEEYKQIMGDDFCKNGDCLDKICSEYKLLCCKEHPSSPNC